MEQSRTSHTRCAGHYWAALVTLLAVVVLLLSACGDSTETAERQPIRISAYSVQGDELDFADLGDTDTLVWFWAPW